MSLFKDKDDFFKQNEEIEYKTLFYYDEPLLWFQYEINEKRLYLYSKDFNKDRGYIVAHIPLTIYEKAKCGSLSAYSMWRSAKRYYIEDYDGNRLRVTNDLIKKSIQLKDNPFRESENYEL